MQNYIFHKKWGEYSFFKTVTDAPISLLSLYLLLNENISVFACTICVYPSGLAFQDISPAFLNCLAMCSGSAGLFSLTPKQEMGIRGWKVRGRTAWQIEPGWWKGQRWEGHFLTDFYPSINTIHHLATVNTHEWEHGACTPFVQNTLLEKTCKKNNKKKNKNGGI